MKIRIVLRTNTDKKRAYQLLLSTHCSIAFACRQNPETVREGINIFPVQKTATHGTELWGEALTGREYPKWKISDSGPVENKYDTALILNVTETYTMT